MATRKTASKVSKKASLNIDIEAPKKSTKREVAKNLKKMSGVAMCLAVILLVGGVAGGWFGCKYLMRNDCFTLVGKDEITLTVGEVYKDEGVNVISFGKDMKDKVIVKTNMDAKDGGYTSQEIGTYYMVYTVDSIKYGTLFKIQKIRLITFVEESEAEEIITENGGND
ncbi:MAG: hypothetical protein IKM43_00425 [Clostridia bacterium]|nr:hypothetical protein [Clostridia bacterium]